MPWQFYLGLVLGVLVGSLVGFLVGRIMKASGDASVAVERLIENEKRADAERNAVDAQLEKVYDETPRLSGKELQDAINADFDERPGLPADGVRREDPPAK